MRKMQIRLVPLFLLLAVGISFGKNGRFGTSGGGLTLGSTVITGMTDGYIPYNNGGVLGQSILFEDDSNNFIGVNTASPQAPLHVAHTAINDDLSGGADDIAFLVARGDPGTLPGTMGTYASLALAADNMRVGYVVRTSDVVDLEFGDPSNVDAGEIRWSNNGDFFALRINDSELMRLETDGKLGIGTATPAYDLHIDKDGSASGFGYGVQTVHAQTTDATLTTLYTLATATDRDYIIEVFYVASETDGSNEYYAKLIFAVSNVGGTVTEDSESDLFEDDNSAAGAADASGAVSSTDYLIQWTGVAAETWNVQATIAITAVAH